MYTVKRLEEPVYVLERGGEIVWSVGIDLGDASQVPFREELVWESAGVVIVGGGDTVFVLDIETGVRRAAIAVPSLFGHLALTTVPAPGRGEEELLFILGWTDVHAIDGRLETRWIARDVAVDGIVFHEVRGDAVVVSAEMDPPGGWVEVALDARTGIEVSRQDLGITSS
ncbi:hypothetical protein [Polyangium sp. 15x6]|uniref:hypothetical protein n=1 Tax=Polyangium sp. 15x6 TaxID=3042687 RepID=UPI00249CE79D|nr:hypothetical protein [Polyangium sp. 15x6]MDI3285794.1 hypothetical protein [Polyangium sp. 15x6]